MRKEQQSEVGVNHTRLGQEVPKWADLIRRANADGLLFPVRKQTDRNDSQYGRACEKHNRVMVA